MARRARADDERSMDSLMDALTNVVGILLLILIVSSLGISAAVKQIIEDLEPKTEEELAAMISSREKTLENLEELRLSFERTQSQLPTEEEAAQMIAALEEIETNNEDLADKTSDIEEWKAKVDAEEEKKEEQATLVSEADEENRKLAAILAQTPEREVKEARDIVMPNPRVADAESTASYIIVKNGKVYFVGDPYDHVFKIRDVIDQNFTDLAYTGKAVGSYTYPLRTTRQDENDNFIPLMEKIRISRREREALASWGATSITWTNQQGEEANPQSVYQRVIGNDDEAELQVHKYRFDRGKILKFFENGKYGPPDFSYWIVPGGGDRMKVQLQPKTDGGWTPDQFLAGNSAFEQACKRASNARRVLFYYLVAPDSFETYLQARAFSERFRIPAGWEIWEGDKFEPIAFPLRESIRYNLNVLPDAEYMKLANEIGPFLVRERNEEFSQFDQRVSASVPEKLPEGMDRQKFVTTLSEERRLWNHRNLQNWALNTYRTALAAQEAQNDTEIRMETVTWT
ncbi:MAG: hypothetical protein AAF236_07990 [Verrucomicrobiota bacterium]